MLLKLTLRQRLILMMGMVLLPLLGLAVINARLNADLALSRAIDNLQFTAPLVAAHQVKVVDSAHQLLTSIVNVPGLVNGNNAECKRYLARLRSQLPVYTNFGIIGLDGYILCHALDSSNSFVGDRKFFQETLSRRAFTASGYLMGRQSGKPVIIFSMPMLGSQGEATAVAFATIGISEFSTAIDDASGLQKRHVMVTDRQGILLTSNPALPALIGKPAPGPLLQDAVGNMRSGIEKGMGMEGEERIFAFLPAGQGSNAPFFVAISVDRRAVLAPVQRQFWLELAALTLLGLLGGWVAWMQVVRAIVKPAAKIIEATRQFQEGRLDTRIPMPSTDDGNELFRIAAGFNLMAETLQINHKALEAELVRSHAIQGKLKDAQRLARFGYWEVDSVTGQVLWSDELYRFFGLDPQKFELTRESCVQQIHPDDRNFVQKVYTTSFDAGQPLDLQYRIITPAGEVRWVHQFGQHSQLVDGKVVPHSRGVIQDITERKQAELVLARNIALLKSTGALAKVGGWEIISETRLPYWSEEFYRIFDLNPGVALSLEEVIEFFAPQARLILHTRLQAMATDTTGFDLELPMKTATGRHAWVRVQSSPVLQDGKIVRITGVVQDITEQYQAQAHLRLLETCIAHLNDMVVILDAKLSNNFRSAIVFVNCAFERQTGYSRDELMAQGTRILVGPRTQQAALDQLGLAIKNNQPTRTELIFYTKSQQEFWAEVDFMPVFDASGELTHWVTLQRDITLRKLAEQALVDSEQRYAALFEKAPVPMWVHDIVTTRFLAVNDAAVQAYGFSAEEFLAMTVFDIRPEAEHDYLRQSMGNPEQIKASWRDRRKDGSVFSVETVSQPIQYDNHNAYFVVVLDKTAQEKAEKVVQDYLFTLQRAADAAQAITWHQTLEGTMQEIVAQARGVIGAHQGVVSLNGNNNHAQNIHALSLSEKYASYRHFMEPPDGSGIYSMVCENNRLIRMTQAELEAHPRWRGFGAHAAGHPPMRGWLAVPLIGRNGKKIGVLQLSDKYEGEFTKQDEYVALELGHLASTAIENSRLMEEISQLNAGLEQKVLERTVALARQEALFRALADQAPQTVWTTNPDGGATYFNRAWFDLMGGELKDWSGYQWLAIIHPEDVAEVKANWKIAQASQTSFAGIRRLLAKDGSCRTMAYRASPVFDDQGEVAFWVGIDADITEIKNIEAALRLSNQELEAFSYSVSHDLRSPLNTVDGFSRLLAKQLAPQLEGDAGVKVKHYLARIQAGVAQMGQLIEDLLSLSQMTRAQLHTGPVDLSLMARQLTDEWRLRQPEREVAVLIESGLHAEADERLIRVVMENLLSNAWKFTSQMAQAQIFVGQKSDAAGLPVFFVKDNGAGFDMAYSDKLFNPFQRLHEASEFSGTGIGLATVSRVIKRHGGCIWAESAPGCGATFFFTLPQGEAYRPG
ncbi:MAG: domain S-box protein [Polaromonas sp.]|nr:domain S-box protein [Polaromonas sp.]